MAFERASTIDKLTSALNQRDNIISSLTTELEKSRSDRESSTVGAVVDQIENLLNRTGTQDWESNSGR